MIYYNENDPNLGAGLSQFHDELGVLVLIAIRNRPDFDVLFLWGSGEFPIEPIMSLMEKGVLWRDNSDSAGIYRLTKPGYEVIRNLQAVLEALGVWVDRGEGTLRSGRAKQEPKKTRKR